MLWEHGISGSNPDRATIRPVVKRRRRWFTGPEVGVQILAGRH